MKNKLLVVWAIIVTLAVGYQYYNPYSIEDSGSALNMNLSDGQIVTAANSFDLIDAAVTDNDTRITALEDGPTYASDNSVYFGTGEGAVRMFHNAAGNYFSMSPYDGGDWDYTQDFYFDADLSGGGWRVESNFSIIDGIITSYKSDNPTFYLNEYGTTSVARILEDEGNLLIQAGGDSAGESGSGTIHFSGYGSNTDVYDITVRYGGATHDIWHGGNDGTGSTLDADTVDGLEGSYVTSGTDPDTAASGHITHDTDGADVANDSTIRAYDGTNQWPVGSRNVPYQHTFNTSGAVTDDPVWYNDTGMDFNIEYIAINCDSNTVTVTLDEQTSFSNITHLAEIDSLLTDSAGTGIYYTDACASGCEDADISHKVIEAGHGILAAYSGAGVGTILIRGWHNADVD